MEKNHAKLNKQQTAWSKNNMNFTNTMTNLFVNTTKTIQTGLGLFDRAVLVPKGVKHSIVNKVVSIGITGAAAYYSGFPVWLVVIQSLLAFIASFEARRWFIEAAMVYPFLAIGAIVLQPNNMITFAVLVVCKSFLEIYCHIADRIIRTLAAWTADKAHSYYYFWVLAMTILFSVTSTSSYFQGFFQGLVQGLAGN